jgi:hypothetical protein
MNLCRIHRGALGLAAVALGFAAGCTRTEPLPLPTGRVDALIPLPVVVEVDSTAPPLQVGPAGFTWEVEDVWAERAAFWADWLPGPDTSAGGIPLRISQLQTANSQLSTENSKLQTESYLLEISGSGVLLQAGTAEGVFRGLATLRQLLPVEVEGLERKRRWHKDFGCRGCASKTTQDFRTGASCSMSAGIFRSPTSSCAKSTSWPNTNSTCCIFTSRRTKRGASPSTPTRG